eukprot:TRINITY_DN5224_c0_g1_i1.p1 TRINITY_DN5224_c0_g1~~TRINITY_DN5224_c0_g1_i1.p1  ORF type:complete len:361 (-),score=58.84 TRINITY_DN5224_c0_g1_i1:48-1130(-)
MFSIKVKYNEEIRRCSFKERPNFLLFKNTLTKLFSHVSFEKVTIKYQDEEGDLITVSSDIELQEAFSLNNSLLRVFLVTSPLPKVNPSPVAPKTEDDNKPAVHYRVICDGCEKAPIVGNRFKCTTCFDYDLCSDCESKGIHKETGHSFNKIEKPFKPFFRSGRGRGCGRYGRCTRWRSKFCKTGQFSSQENDGDRAHACFVKDVTVPSGTEIFANTEFIKIWKFRNDGKVAWPSNSRLVFSFGDKLTKSDYVSVEEAVKPGDEVDVAVAMVAPSLPGKYVSYWQLSSPDDHAFYGPKVWVDILVKERVKEPESTYSKKESDTEICLKILKEMGLTDEERNRIALIKNNNDISGAVRDLLL